MFGRMLVFIMCLIPNTSISSYQIINDDFILIEHIEVVEDSEQIECLAKNIYFESRNQPLVGQVAVGLVTINRVKSSRYPNTVCEVVYQAVVYENWKGNIVPKRNACQFSWYCDGLPETINDESSWSNAISLARKIINNEIIDITEGSLFYHSNKVSPNWSKTMRKSVQIEDHIFYKG